MKSAADELSISIDQIAGKQTERKEPPKVKSDEPSTGTPIEPEEVKDFSGRYDPDEEEAKKKENEKPETDRESIDASAKTAAYLLSGMIETGFGFAERVVYLSKFTKEEKRRIVDNQEKDESSFDDEDKRVNRKFLAVSKKHEGIRKKIPLSERDEQAFEDACREYTRITGKVMSPNLILWSTIIKVITSRSIDIFLD